MRAVVVENLGGPEAMQLQQWPEPQAAPGELLVDIEFAGINFMDTKTRSLGTGDGRMPFILGVEASGRVSAVGVGVDTYAVGDRVAWVFNYGSYAEKIAVPADRVVPIPDDIPGDVAAATMMQGLTAHHFVNESAPLARGQVALVHAAAGGVGRFLIQLLKLRGVTVIGLVSREEKVPVAKEAGADHVLVSRDGDFVGHVNALTNDEGVHAVFDGGGATTFRSSIDVLRRSGTLVYYGPLMGDVPTVRMTDLPKSIKVTYAVFSDHIHTPELLKKHSADLFDMIRNGELKIDITRRYALADATQAHIDIQSRGTTGKLLFDTSL
ncbi:quinone oxidoreductase [Streptomyces kunmingensis]|uniref:Quinone oxidoreductase n=1 Tax=Streptomyces kunmingensis TaxID=68225 RepID=A0ABU6C2G6_9ACTN|nr:quinone oxidoreductase [Streptomyces kunmingensis]MEB3958901.1 quinone oxidoreductase [Streptomyces kunmingensis]